MATLRTLAARWRCHQSVWCCQYVDEPNCSSWNDPHALARWRYRRRSRREQRAEEG